MSPQTAAYNADTVAEDRMLMNKEMSIIVNSKVKLDENSVDNSELSKLDSETLPAGEMLNISRSAHLLTITGLDLSDSEKSTETSFQPAGKEEFSGGCTEQTSADTSDQGEDGTGRRAHASSRVAVIGAGAGGLVAARELVREEHSVVIYEQGKEVGGMWNYDARVESDPLGKDPNRSRVHSSLYEALRTNLPRELMGYLDYPFVPNEGEGRDGRRFPYHGEVAQYLKDFSNEYNLVGLVKFGVKVEYVGPEALKGANTKWVVKGRRSDASPIRKGSCDMACWEDEIETEVFDAVVVCTGHYTEPRIANIPGVESWPGLQLHSHNYRFPHPFEDKVVVVIGSAASAEDISKELASFAKEVHVCARAWTSIEHSTEGKGPQRNLWQHPMVQAAYSDGTVEFQDGTSVVAGVILHCTGYLHSFPFLDANGHVSVDDNRVGPLYKHVFPPALAPTLSFVGVIFKVGIGYILGLSGGLRRVKDGFTRRDTFTMEEVFEICSEVQYLLEALRHPLMELQSRWIAQVLSQKLSLPTQSEMMTDVENLYEDLEVNNIPKKETHNLDLPQFEYGNWLAGQTGHEPIEAWRKEMLSAHKNNRSSDTYRDD